MSREDKKPFCVKGGECIGNVPTISELEGYIKIIEYHENASALVIDGGWHELDISPIIGVNKRLVYLTLNMYDITVNSGAYMMIRGKNGVASMQFYSNDGQINKVCVLVCTDSLGVIEYRVSDFMDSASIVVEWSQPIL